MGGPSQGGPPAPPGSAMPTAHAMPGDIELPPESGQIDPRLPAAHLPPHLRQRLLREALLKDMR